MSKTFFEVRKGISLLGQGAAPSDPQNGDQYYDNILNAVRYYINGSWVNFTGAGSGSVTSVSLTAPGIFSVSGSPVTTSGTLALSLVTQTANTVFSGPSSGSAAAPTFRALTSLDLPGIIPNIQTGISYTVLSSDINKLIVMTNTGVRAVTLPTSPANGFTVAIKDGAQNADVHNITVSSGGSDVIEMSGTTSYVINSEGQAVVFVYSSSNTTWYVV